MAFHDVRLPEDLERGAVGGPGFKTTVISLTSGHEQRNIDWLKTRASYDVGYGLMRQKEATLDATVDVLLAFFYARQGMAHGFRFKDWSDYRLGLYLSPTTDNQSIGTGDGAKVAFQVFKRYSSGGIDFDRDLTALVSGRVVILIDNVVQTEGPDYSVDLLTGIVTFATAPAAGEDVQAALEFDVPVRFDIDVMNVNVEIFDTGSWPNIPIVERRP